MTQHASEEPWKVGVLFSQSGFMAVIEETQLRGTLTAIDEINDRGGINGRPIEPVIYDPASDAQSFGRYAKRLMVEDGVTAMFGCYTSTSRKAVLPVVERLNGLLWYPTIYEGFEFSRNVIYTGASPNQNSIALCRFLMDHYGTRFYFIGSDYVFPRESNRIMRELVRHSGGEVAAVRYVDMNARNKDFAPIMQEIRDLQPDVIFSTVVGEATVHLYQSYKDSGFDPKVMPIASLTTCEAEVLAMGFDVGEGHITAAPYFEGIGGDESSTFVTRYRKRYGDDQPTNTCLEAAYFQVHVFAKCVEKVNSLDTDILRATALGSEFQAPQGNISINPICGHADLWTRIGCVNRRGKFDLVYDSGARVSADPYMIGYSRSVAAVG